MKAIKKAAKGNPFANKAPPFGKKAAGKGKPPPFKKK